MNVDILSQIPSIAQVNHHTSNKVGVLEDSVSILILSHLIILAPRRSGGHLHAGLQVLEDRDERKTLQGQRLSGRHQKSY